MSLEPSKAVEQAIETNRIAEKGIAIDNRPWIAIESINMGNFLPCNVEKNMADGIQYFEYMCSPSTSIKNIGKGPAIDIFCTCKYVLRYEEITEKIADERLKKYGSSQISVFGSPFYMESGVPSFIEESRRKSRAFIDTPKMVLGSNESHTTGGTFDKSEVINILKEDDLNTLEMQYCICVYVAYKAPSSKIWHESWAAFNVESEWHNHSLPVLLDSAITSGHVRAVLAQRHME